MLSILLQLSAAHAYYPSEDDLRFLPSYCVARYNNDNPAYASKVNKWKNIFGRETWTSFHHYCQGVNYVARGYRGVNPNTKKKDYEDGIENLTKHLEIYGPKFPIKAQTHYLIGSAYKGLGQLSQAIQHYRMAISIEPRYSKSYQALSDVLVELGNLSDAESAVQAGLKISPKSKGLLRRKAKIDAQLAAEQNLKN